MYTFTPKDIRLDECIWVYPNTYAFTRTLCRMRRTKGTIGGSNTLWKDNGRRSPAWAQPKVVDTCQEKTFTLESYMLTLTYIRLQ